MKISQTLEISTKEILKIFVKSVDISLIEWYYIYIKRRGDTKMYKDYRFINAGTNEFYRWGKKAQSKVASFLEPNENGFYSMPADGGDYYAIGTSEGKYGEFAKFKDTFLSVNKAGYVWAKVGTDKANAFVEMVNMLLSNMKEKANEIHNDEDCE